MKKDAVICFRLSEELKRALEQIAKVERRSLSSTIENILYNFAGKTPLLQGRG